MKKYLFLLIIPLLNSCSKSVYMLSSDGVTAKYVIYKKNYTYIEQTNTSKFKTKGSYEISDSSIVFKHRDGSKIPYHYLNNRFQKIKKNEDSEYLNLRVMYTASNDPLRRATIIAKDKSGNSIYKTVTDLKGKAQIKKDNSIKTLELNYLGFNNHTMEYQEIESWDILWEVHTLKKGGRLRGQCLVEYIDFVLDYTLDNSVLPTRFSKNGYVFKKINR